MRAGGRGASAKAGNCSATSAAFRRAARLVAEDVDFARVTSRGGVCSMWPGTEGAGGVARGDRDARHAAAGLRDAVADA